MNLGVDDLLVHIGQVGSGGSGAAPEVFHGLFHFRPDKGPEDVFHCLDIVLHTLGAEAVFHGLSDEEIVPSGIDDEFRGVASKVHHVPAAPAAAHAEGLADKVLYDPVNAFPGKIEGSRGIHIRAPKRCGG